MSKIHNFDVLIIGSGSAGLITAINISEDLSVAIISKDRFLEGSSYYAQGGISAVFDSSDNFNSHIEDTLITGARLGREEAVRFMVEKAPQAIIDLEKTGVKFSRKGSSYDLTTEGGHSAKRVVHVADKTGESIQTNLLRTAKKRKNIKLFEYSMAIDLLLKDNKCFGSYVYNIKESSVCSFIAKKTIIATGGCSAVYLYNSNPNTSTGDGIAMAFRAGCDIVNMEFAQFHPTCVFKSQDESFLISETLRGEGAKLSLPNNKKFMHKYDEREEMASRDIVARAIDNEMKVNGIDFVHLDISFKDSNWILKRFPMIAKRCSEIGIDITKDKIPVVPAAHYTCGGINIDIDTKTNVVNLYAVGEASHSGVHGANRMASNSLLECIVFAKTCAKNINNSDIRNSKTPDFSFWDSSKVKKSKEKVVLTHILQEVRLIMWNFVGIVRNDSRLNSARMRLVQIEKDINNYYKLYIISKDLLELRNLVHSAKIIVDSAILRKESRGLHFNTDYPKQLQFAKNSVIIKK